MQQAQRSAKIYLFPAHVRAAVNAARLETKSSADLRAAGAPEILSGSGWYHEAAMRDAQPTAKH